MKDVKIAKNSYGYYEVSEKPSNEELGKYYSEKYYQSGQGAYDKQGAYSEDEKKYFINKIEQKYIAALSIKSGLMNGKKKFLDIGAGEGWALNYFSSIGWECLGIDFSNHGCVINNPSQLDNLLVGDIYTNLDGLCEKQHEFDIVLLDNVLEHVVNPLQMLADIRKVVSRDGLLIVEVPNDYSVIQEVLYNKGFVSKEYWKCFPDHLSYFNHTGLSSLASDAGWEVEKVLTSYPIDLNLFNSYTNYVENKSVGKSCHKSRVEIENLLHSVSVHKTIKLYEAMADMGIGRDIIMLMSRD